MILVLPDIANLCLPPIFFLDKLARGLLILLILSNWFPPYFPVFYFIDIWSDHYYFLSSAFLDFTFSHLLSANWGHWYETFPFFPPMLVFSAINFPLRTASEFSIKCPMDYENSHFSWWEDAFFLALCKLQGIVPINPFRWFFPWPLVPNTQLSSPGGPSVSFSFCSSHLSSTLPQEL